MKCPLILSLFLITCCCTKSKIEADKFQIPLVPKLFTLKTAYNIEIKNDTAFLDKKRYSGYLFELHASTSDTLYLQGFLDGVQNGIEKKWFSNKQLMEQRYFVNGQKNGKHVVFWENGFKKFEFTARNDAYEGEMKEWNSNGSLIHLGNYKNGQENGVQKLWYDSGKIRANYVIIDGKRYGLLGTKNCRNVSDSIFIVK